MQIPISFSLAFSFTFFIPFFAAVALSVIDTSSSNFFAENWTQFPYSEFVAQTGVAGSSEEVLLESSDNNNQKKVNNAAVTVNSNKELQNPATSAISSSKDTKDRVCSENDQIWVFESIRSKTKLSEPISGTFFSRNQNLLLLRSRMIWD